ncbi:MAG: ABC transporter ATP-binding protein [Gammaproteobacteria bacterium]|nr:ABC transporter ATP-binding protein [Gammaproteobacteria bacterium]NIR84890.1 ABC transporter ATP-binding protein [Gammaproteobacteria bacterium]NIR91739.1 ABC transporter ATP-binding protein [Gammaproteobacteria bacterium]NIU05937.1 ABC transporter ATP-binding protein [Gammaproteobacteria bacterium]NIV52984.1 ATP-binding cassette domain-containing protein [Gammaproteobacteria bacterium]
MLSVDRIEASYGTLQILFGMSLEIDAGEVVTLLGRNGMGKTTTIRTIMGLLRPHAGTIEFDGKAIHRLPSYKVAQCGLGLVPEGRQVFPNLSVRENLVAFARNSAERADPWTLEKVLELFPALAERRDNVGSQLSGGEQQMLAIARALMTNPKLLLLDEATEGLAPLIRAEIWRVLAELKGMGQAILVIDKSVDALTQIADRHYMIEKGVVVWTGSSDDLRNARDVQHRYLGV